MNPDNLKRTVAKWNEFCKTQKGDEFGRMSCEEGNKLPGGPYYASVMTPSVHHTMGGVTIDEDTRVLDKNRQAYSRSLRSRRNYRRYPRDEPVSDVMRFPMH